MYFYPRSPCGERHSGYLDTRQLCAISIHALLAESDAIDKWDKNDFYKFLSTLSLRRATVIASRVYEGIRFLSTLSLRRATVNPYKLTMIFGISIHALLAESDSNACCAATISRLFLSTLSLRRATYYLADYGNNVAISIHALLAESDYIRSNVPNFSSISIHALLAESDGAATLAKYQYLHFYPRSPCGERLLLTVVPYGQYKISIHALLAESDISQLQCIHGRKHFYPRSPCGERLFRQNYECFEWIISIHALLAESDRLCTILYSCPGNFYPRSPCGERLAKQLDRSPPLTFLSTLSLRRATVGASQGANIEHISIHALLAESDSYNLKIHQKQENFYPRSPCGERRQ